MTDNREVGGNQQFDPDEEDPMFAKPPARSPVSICIAHAAWNDKRKEPLHKLLAQCKPPAPRVFPSVDPEHASVWFIRILKDTLHDKRPLLLLNDDVEIIPNLAKIAEAILEGVPDQEIFSLYNPYDQSVGLMKEGKRFVRTWHVSGPGFLIRNPAKALAYFESLPKWFREAKEVHEDGWLTQWAYERRQPVWTAIPSLVQHDASIPSTLGFEHHRFRTSPVFPTQTAQKDAPSLEKLKSKQYWQTVGAPPFIDAPFFPETYLAEMQGAIERYRAFEAPGPWCVFCLRRKSEIKSDETGAGLCGQCAKQVSTLE